MILQYFKKKENEYNVEANKIYQIILDDAKVLVNKNYFTEISFDSSFEIITILLVFYLKTYNENLPNKKNKINDELIQIFINDLDKSMREIGIGDMSLGKYVKKYVKKFYYRVKILDPVLDDFSDKELFNYLKNLKLINNSNIKNITNDLVVIYSHINKNKSK